MTCQQFKTPSGRLVTFNRSADDAAFPTNVSLKEMREIIAEYEEKRIAEYWEDTLLASSKQGRWIRAFDSHGALLDYFQVSALRRISGTNARGRALWTHVRSLSLSEQRAIVNAARPKSRVQVTKIIRPFREILAPDFHAMLKESGSAKALVQNLTTALRTGGCALRHPFRYFELLALMWSKGRLLFPAGVHKWNTTTKYLTLLNARYGGSRSLLIQSVARKPKKQGDQAFRSVCSALASSDVAEATDLSPELMAAFEDVFVAMVEAQYPQTVDEYKWMVNRGRVRTGMLWLRQFYNRHNPDNAILLARPPRKRPHERELRLKGDFRWLTEQRPELVEWQRALHAYIASTSTLRIHGPVDKLNQFGDFLCMLNEPPLAPWNVARATHITDPTLTNKDTFFDYLSKRYPESDPKTKNGIVAKLRVFFDWVKDRLLESAHPEAAAFANPIFSKDNFGRRVRGGVTNRPRMENYIINEMKEILTSDDFAFPKLLQGANTDVFDNTLGKKAKVWDPTLTVCMYTLLDTVLRSHQARWLDSGELDERIYDESSGKLKPNRTKHAVRGRLEGALRLQHDSLRSNSWLTLWVNTNKTAEYDSAEIGYPVPFMSETLKGLLLMQRDWQRRYLPQLETPVPYADYQRDTTERPRVAAKLPTIAPLFRDAMGPSLIKPIAYAKLKKFYTKLLMEAQDRIEKKYGRKVQLVRTVNGKVKWEVDLHTLRVSGITALIEAGVPLEVVSQFVAGHRTLVMTLHYLKFSPAKLRAYLEKAHEKLRDDSDFTGSPEFEENMDAFAPFMLSQAGSGVGPAFAALKQKNGLLTINTEGICPGTSCDTGGPLIGKGCNAHAPVPGGQRCGLCRYWLTGPAHLLGQVAAVNNLAYAIRKKGQEIAELNEQRLDAEDQGNQRKARELVDKVELLGRELTIDINEWVARYRYAEKSITLMDDYLAAKAKVQAKGQKLPVPLLTAAAPSQLKITLESAHEFALLDQITQMSDFVTGFRNREAELEKSSILSSMMVANGIRPFLLELKPEHAHAAGNLLSSMLLHQVRGQELDEVLDGHKPLSDYPALARAFELLESQVVAGTKVQNIEQSRLEKLLNSFQPHGQPDFDEEETFS
ncbi:VPA1269 family protein [Paraburkholderia phytofirmans]|uniref:VPA1269 family protein n=1 Tax=Paraburkholderia phytofirmans TaxID=261302 RepID=UPI0038B772CF